jgi:hypothetical protein
VGNNELSGLRPDNKRNVFVWEPLYFGKVLYNNWINHPFSAREHSPNVGNNELSGLRPDNKRGVFSVRTYQLFIGSQIYHPFSAREATPSGIVQWEGILCVIAKGMCFFENLPIIIRFSITIESIIPLVPASVASTVPLWATTNRWDFVPIPKGVCLVGEPLYFGKVLYNNWINHSFSSRERSEHSPNVGNNELSGLRPDNKRGVFSVRTFVFLVGSL